MSCGILCDRRRLASIRLHEKVACFRNPYANGDSNRLVGVSNRCAFDRQRVAPESQRPHGSTNRDDGSSNDIAPLLQATRSGPRVV
jgi:hypothetical protein